MRTYCAICKRVTCENTPIIVCNTYYAVIRGVKYHVSFCKQPN